MRNFKSAYLLLLLFSFLNQNCKKKSSSPTPEPIVAAPDPYTYNNELQSSKDITFANMVITDMEMMGAFLCENELTIKFYNPAGSSTISVTRDTQNKFNAISFNNTKCVDGRTRDGSVVFDCSSAGPNAVLYHDEGFAAKLTPINYVVDGWMIELFDSNKPLVITNKVPQNYDPTTTNLFWQIAGKLLLTNKTDPTRSMIWDGVLIKTLINTNNPAVFNPNKQGLIAWPIAAVTYSGNISGFTSVNVPFTEKIDNAPVKRDFNCNFIPTNSTDIIEFHPFISGIATFSTSNYHPRTINYGPNDPGLCDFKGTVSFKDETHDVDFD